MYIYIYIYIYIGSPMYIIDLLGRAAEVYAERCLFCSHRSSNIAAHQNDAF